MRNPSSAYVDLLHNLTLAQAVGVGIGLPRCVVSRRAPHEAQSTRRLQLNATCLSAVFAAAPPQKFTRQDTPLGKGADLILDEPLLTVRSRNRRDRRQAPRRTAVAMSALLCGAGESQVPRWTGRSLEKSPPAAMGRKRSRLSAPTLTAVLPDRSLHPNRESANKVRRSNGARPGSCCATFPRGAPRFGRRVHFTPHHLSASPMMGDMLVFHFNRAGTRMKPSFLAERAGFEPAEGY